MNQAERICVALDVPSGARALELAAALKGRVGLFKVGLELFSAGGPELVRRLVEQGCGVFLDLKLHDIPNTVAGAARSISTLGCTYFNVHACGGVRMMQAAVEASRESSRQSSGPHRPAPKVLAVTVLTSLTSKEYADEALGRLSLRRAVQRFAVLARSAGLHGVVASALEIQVLRRAMGPDFIIVVPGIRPSGSDAGDQRRTMTPGEAVSLGADVIVVGRPVIAAKNPISVVESMIEEMEGAGDGS